MPFIDRILNYIPMYRLTLYYIVGLWVIAIIAAVFGAIPYTPLAIACSGLFLFAVCNITSELLAWGFSTPANHESATITALILALILTPASTVQSLAVLAMAGFIAMASKYLIVFKRKHLFNPAAFAAVVMGLVFGHTASWWVATLALAPFVAIGGYLLVRQIARLDLVLSFIATAVVVGSGYYLVLGQGTLASILNQIVVNSALLFLGFVMLTEPITSPPTRMLRLMYGTLVGFLFLPFVHVGSFYFTPEFALLAGNLFVFLVSPHERFLLTLVRKNKLSPDLFEFVFEPAEALSFKPGQYLEWTLGNVALDAKGNRRYFTIASSPGEHDLRIAIRLQEPVSNFKQALMRLEPGDTVSASQLAGDFTLPNKIDRKIAMIAGGIGVTPFRSMVQHMLDTNDRRSATLLYAGRTPSDLVYADVFERAREELGMRASYIVSSPDGTAWDGAVGRITPDIIVKAIPDYAERTFYISGSHAMVTSIKQSLRDLGVARRRIKTDYFPGFV